MKSDAIDARVVGYAKPALVGDMAKPGDQLREDWVESGNSMIAAGDGPTINEWLASKLVKIQIDLSGWRILYQHRETEQF